MKLKRISVAALLAAASVAAAAAGEDQSQWEKLKAYSHHQKTEAVVEGKKLLAETDEKIDELKGQAKAVSAGTKSAYERSMEDLKEKKVAAKIQLDKLERSSSGAWEATKEGFSDAYRDLRRAYEKAVASARR
jgi:hypothetical protein